MKKLIVVSSVVAEHDRAQDFNRVLRVVADIRKGVVETLTEESVIAQEKLTYEFEYRVFSAKQEPFVAKDLLENDPVRVIRAWMNKEQWETMSKYYGVRCPPIPERTVSSIYARVNNVLVKGDNSGIDLLDSNVEISDEEWATIKRGDVSKVLRSRTKKAA